MSQFILVHRIIQDGCVPTWINIGHIAAMETTNGGEHTRLNMGLEGYCVVSESVTSILDAIRRANDDR